MSQLSDVTSMLRSQGYGPTLTSLSKQYRVPEDTVSLFVVLKAIQLSKGSGSLSSEKVSAPPECSQNVREIPAVATLSRPPKESAIHKLLDKSRGARYDPRLAITDFSSLPTRKALETIDFLLSTGVASKTQISAIHTYLFETKKAFQAFLTLNGHTIDAQNQQFELFLKVMDTDLLNKHNTTWLPQVLKFAFSSIRMDWIQIQNSEIEPELNRAMLEYESTHLSKDISGDISKFQSSSLIKYREWVALRMNGSKTISTQTNITQTAKKNWLDTEEKTREKAESQGKLLQRIGFGTVRILHKCLTKGEEENAGVTRKKIVRSSMADELYPPPENVEDMASNYESWLNQQIELCQSGRKSIILTAAQAYQRLVSIHPFDGGNGRISRQMMDYTLVRFGLPPAALGESVGDAVFGLKVKSPQNQEEFVRKVFEGVQRSYKMIHGG